MFGRKEVIRGVFQVYQGTRRTSPLGSVAVRNEIIDAAGRAVREQSLSIAPSQFEQRTAFQAGSFIRLRSRVSSPRASARCPAEAAPPRRRTTTRTSLHCRIKHLQ